MTPPKPKAVVTSLPGEQWVTMFPPYGRYWISSEGRVYSTISCKIMAQYVTFRGRRRIPECATVRAVLRNDRGKPQAVAVANQLLLAFEGMPEADSIPSYRNGDRLDVRWANLEWMVRAGSMREHMAKIAPKGFAASPVAQANAGNVENLR